MITYKPGMTFVGQFCTQRFDTGTATDADSLPVATASKNGTDDAGFVLTVANIDTGRYRVTGTIPLTYVTEDVVHVSVVAVVNGVSGKAVVGEFVIEEASGANAVTITVRQADLTPIPDVSVRILNSAQTLTLKTATTNAIGQVVTALNDGSYKVRLSKSLVNFTVPETLTVSGTTTIAYTGAPISVTAPATGLQTLIIFPTDLGLTMSTTAVITARIKRLNTIIDTAVITSQQLLAVDHTTHWEMQIVKGADVEIVGKEGTSKFYNKEITITDDDSRNLSDYD